MKKLIAWIKWKTYIRWKNMWASFFFLRGKWSSSFGLVALIYDTVQAIFYVLAYYSLFQFIILNESITNLQLDGLLINYIINILSEIQDSTLYLWNIYFLIVFIYCVFIGFKSSRWSQFSNDRELLKNIIPNKFIELFLFVESIVWNFRIFFLRIILLGIVLIIVTKQPIVNVFLLLIILILLYIFLGLLFAMVHYLYIFYRSYLINKYLLVFQLILFKTLSFLLGYLFSHQLYWWIKQAPFLSADFTSEQLRSWMNKGTETFWLSLLFIIEDRRLPYNYFSYRIYNDDFFPLLMGLMIGILFIVIALVYAQKFIYKFDGYNRNLNDNILPILESVHYKTLFLFHSLKKVGNYFKISYRSPIVLKRVNHIAGNSLYWFIVGVFSGLLLDSEVYSKVSILILYTLFYFHVYFFYENFYETFKGVLSLDSEGKNAFLYLYAENNLWHLLKMKMLVAFTYASFIILAGDFVIFVITGISFKILVWIILNHLAILLTVGILQFIPSVYNIRFNFFNIEQLEDFADKKIISSVINFSTVGVIIPVLMLPCVLYILDSINLSEAFILNVVFLIVIVVISLSILLLFKYRLKKRSFITGR